MTPDITLPRTEPRRPASLPHEPAQIAARPFQPALAPHEPGVPAAHASPQAWAAPGTPEALIERRLACANAHVADPAARVARTLCVLARCALDHPQPMQALAAGFPGTSAAQALRFDVAAGQLEGRFSACGLAAAALAAVGVADIALRRALAPGPETALPHLVRELAFGLLRALGLPDSVAGEVARDAAGELFAPPN